MRSPSGRYAPLHPAVQGLLDVLPETGTDWAIEERIKWLKAAASIFDLMFSGDGSVIVRMSEGNG